MIATVGSNWNDGATAVVTRTYMLMVPQIWRHSQGYQEVYCNGIEAKHD